MKASTISLFLILCVSLAFVSANPSGDNCGALDANFTLNASVSTTGTCFTVIADNITLDCQGNTITYRTSANGYGVYDAGYDDLTVKNCVITASTNGGASHGIYLYNGADNAVLDNNTINAWSGFGVYTQLSSNNARITDSRITSTTNIAVYVYDSVDTWIANNSLIQATASAGIYLDHSSASTRIENNEMIRGGVAAGTYGIYVTDESDGAIIQNNTIYGRTYALYLYSSIDASIVAGNNLTSQTDIAVYLRQNAENNVFENNSITSGTSNDYGVYFNGWCSGNNFTNNIITATGDAVYATASSQNNLFYNNTLTATRYGVYMIVSCSGWNITKNEINTANTGIWLGNDINNMIIRDNNITSTNTYGIQAGTSTNVNVTSNNIVAYSHGVYLPTSSGLRFENNTINSTAGIGVYLYVSSNNYFLNNIIASTSAVGVSLFSSSNNNYFLNNTITGGNGGTDYGVYIQTACTGNSFYNNTINGPVDAAVYITGASTGNNFYYNNILGTGAGAEGVIVTGSGTNKFYYNNITSLLNYAFQVADSQYTEIINSTIESRGTGAFAGVYMSGTSQYNKIDNCSITAGLGANMRALYFNTASSNNVTNTVLQANASYPIYLYYATSNNFKNVTATSLTSYGAYLYTSSSNTFNNVNISSNTNLGIRICYSSSNNIFTDCELVSNSNYAVYIDNNADNNTFNRGKIYSVDADAVYVITNADNEKFYNTNITAGPGAGDYGMELYTNADNIQVVNTTITAPGDNDLRLNGDSDIYFLNVTFSEFDVTFIDSLSSLNLSWFARVRTMSGGNPIEEASVSVKDAFDTTVYSGLTHDNGYSAYFPVTEYIRVSAGGLTYYTPHNFTATMGPASSSASQSISDNTDITVALDADACGAISTDTVLRNNVYAGGTCFTIVTSGVTLDCDGYAINYSRRSAGYGISVTGKNNVIIKNCTILQDALNSTSHAVYFSNADNNTVWNSTIIVRDAKSFYLAADSDDYAIATTFNKSNSQYADASSSLNVSWYLAPSVTDLFGTPIENARLTVYDSLSNLVLNETTDAYGLASTNAFTEYVENSTGKRYYTSYTLNASKGSVSNSTSVNLTASSSTVVQLNASTCGALSANRVLTNDVDAGGTCFTAAANDVTLDCAGYAINYSRSATGYAVNITGFNNMHLTNCRLIQGTSGTDSHAVYLDNADNALVANATVETDGAYDYYLAGSNNAGLVNSTYEDSRVFMDASSSNLSVYWPVTILVLGLADETVPNAPVLIRNQADSLVFSGTTDAAGRAYAEIRGWVKENAGIANETPHNFTASHPETNYDTTQFVTVDSAKNVLITVISASVNITSPAENTIYFQGQTVPIYVNETKGSTWITNVTVSIYGDGIELEHQATEETPGYWLYSYNIDPAMTSRVLTIHARGYNGTTFVQDNSTVIVTRATGGGIENPEISYLCPNNTYVVAGSNTTINATADLDTVIYTMVVNVTYPDASTAVLPAIASSSDGTHYIYSYLYDFNATQTGDYVINATARDVNDQWVSSTQSLYAVASADAVSFTGSGISTYYVKDICSSAVILSGAGSISGSIPAGKYDLVAETTEPRITLYNASLNSTVSGIVLAYSDPGLGAVTPPTNRRNVALFEVSSQTAGYDSAEVYYNYSSVAGSLVAEASLEMRKCESTGNCTWESIPFTLNAAGDVIYGSSSSLSVWGVFEPAFPDPQNNTEYVYITEYSTSTSIVTKEVEVPVIVTRNVPVPFEVKEYVSISIIENPGAIEMYSEDSKTMTLQLNNNEEVDLSGITLSLESNEQLVSVAADETNIGELKSGEGRSVLLRFKTDNAPEGDYSVKVTASVGSMDLTDIAYIPVRVNEYLSVDKLQAEEMINFAETLMNDNPECMEFKQTLDEASETLERGEVTLALDKARSVVNACKKIISLLGEEDNSPATGLVAARTAIGTDWFQSFVMVCVGIGLTLTTLFASKMFKGSKGREREGA